jgi:hypothetical protein
MKRAGGGRSNAPKEGRKIFFGQGSTQPFEKAQFRKGNPRKSKEIQAFFFAGFCSGLAGLCWIRLNLESACLI